MQEQDSSIFPEISVSYASFGERFAAAFIDGLILMVPLWGIKYLIDGSLSEYGLGSIATFVVRWLYYALMESGSAQATLGKQAMGIKVGTENGDRISFGSATGRYFAKIISGIILCIGYLMMLWDRKRQTLHDRIAGTVVISR